jgi:hypothetical protein
MESRGSLPDTLYKGGKSFAVYPRRGSGIGENAVLGKEATSAHRRRDRSKFRDSFAQSQSL